MVFGHTIFDLVRSVATAVTWLRIVIFGGIFRILGVFKFLICGVRFIFVVIIFRIIITIFVKLLIVLMIKFCI